MICCKFRAKLQKHFESHKQYCAIKMQVSDVEYFTENILTLDNFPKKGNGHSME